MTGNASEDKFIKSVTKRLKELSRRVMKLDTKDEILQAYCAERLAVYMTPKAYIQLDTFPLNPVGKINKKVLVKQFEQLIST